MLMMSVYVRGEVSSSVDETMPSVCHIVVVPYIVFKQNWLHFFFLEGTITEYKAWEVA